VERNGHRGPSRRTAFRAALLAQACLAAAAFAQPAPAAAGGGDSFHDAVIGDPVVTGAKASAAAATTSSAVGYPVPGGGSVKLDVDPAYAGTSEIQRVLDTLGATVHGDEINRLTVHLADASTLSQLCGPNSTACYFPSSMTMVVSGSPLNPNNLMPQGMVITHEYGHHIEANRSFEGWYATNLGGRHWATYERVCEGVAGGSLFPGDEGAHYWENPGEAFAQAYATMLYPNAVPWWWSFAEPSQGAFQAIRDDVADTSPGSAVQWSGKLNRRRSTATTTIDAALDGPIGVTVRQPRTAQFQVSLLSTDGRVLSRATSTRAVAKGRKGKRKGKKARAKRRKASVTQLSYGTCSLGSRSFQVQVSRVAGKGKFTAEIVRP
jgi:hypothetical protein